MDKLQTITPLTEKVVELYSRGVKKKDIAFELGMTTVEVTRFLAKPEIQILVNDIIKTTGNAIVAKNLGLIEDIIEAKLERIKNTDDKTMADATSKDIVDLMSIVSNMTIAKERLETEQDSNTYIQILNGILK